MANRQDIVKKSKVSQDLIKCFIKEVENSDSFP